MKVYVKKVVEGESIPGIIKNGEYFLTKFGVYEDGTISCWERNDFAKFKESISKQWVICEVPKGSVLSVFQLGRFKIEQAEWKYNEESYYKHILEIVKTLNPEMKNIYTETPRIKEKWDKARVKFSDNPIDCKLAHKFGYSFTDGESNFIFYNQKGKSCITFLTAYADKSFRIGAIPDREFTFAQVEEMFQKGILSTTVDENIWIEIEHLGKVKLLAFSTSIVSTEEKLKELEERMKKLANEPTAHDICIEAYHNYLEFPCEESREILRKAYENVPEHERCYLGDMDTRDTDYIRILYNPESKREV